jgi:hypothetical protein
MKMVPQCPTLSTNARIAHKPHSDAQELRDAIDLAPNNLSVVILYIY